MSPKDLLDLLEHNLLKQDIARHLISHAEKEKISNLRYLPFIRIKDISGHNNDALILDTLLFMIKHECIYETRWEFIDQYDDAFEIDYESVIEAQKSNIYNHPETNEVVNNPTSMMSMYFTVNRLFKTNKLSHAGAKIGS